MKPDFYLAGNPLVCSCENQWLVSPGAGPADRLPRLSDLEALTCALNYNGNRTVTAAVVSVPPNQFLCEYTSHCFSLCMCCDFFGCDCRMQCPDGCACFHDTTWSANIIQCSARGHTDIPPLIPMDATSVFLDGNNFIDLSGQMFLGRSRMKSLYLNASSVVNISNNTFFGLHDLQTLDLSHNFLQVLKGEEFAPLVNLKELLLHSNKLIQISTDAFRPLSSLSRLRLDNNLLTTFPIWELASNTFIAGITVADNAWTCDCTFLNKFRMFIDGNLDKVLDARAVKCNINRLSTADKDSFFQANNNNKSCIETGVSGRGFGTSSTDLVVISLGCIVILVTAVLVIFFCRREGAVKRLMLMAGKPLSSSSSSKVGGGDHNQNRTVYDLLVSYTPEDEHIALKLADTLESMRMCLQYRDLFQPSANYKALAKVNARSVVVIMSPTYRLLELGKAKDHLVQAVLRSSANLVIITPEAEMTATSSSSSREQADAKSLVGISQAVLSWTDTEFWDNLVRFLPAINPDKCPPAMISPAALHSLAAGGGNSPSMSHTASTRTITEDVRSALNTPTSTTHLRSANTSSSRPKSVFSAVESNSEFIYLTPKPKKARCSEPASHARSVSEIYRQQDSGCGSGSIYHQRSRSGLTPSHSKHRLLAEPSNQFYSPPNSPHQLSQAAPHQQQLAPHQQSAPHQQQPAPQHLQQRQPDASDSRQLYGSTSFIYKLISSSNSSSPAKKEEPVSQPQGSPADDKRLYVQRKGGQQQHHQRSTSLLASTNNTAAANTSHNNPHKRSIHKKSKSAILEKKSVLPDTLLQEVELDNGGGGGGGGGGLHLSLSHSSLFQNHLLSPQNPQQLLLADPRLRLGQQLQQLDHQQLQQLDHQQSTYLSSRHPPTSEHQRQLPQNDQLLLLQQLPHQLLNSRNQQLTTQTLTRSFSQLNGGGGGITLPYPHGSFTATRRFPSQGFEPGAAAGQELHHGGGGPDGNGSRSAGGGVVHQRSKSTPYQGFVV